MNYYPFIIALIIIIFVLAYCQNVYEYYSTDINETDAYKKGNWKNEAELLDTRINELQEEVEKDPNNETLRKELQALKNNRDFNQRFMENTNFKDVDFHDSIEENDSFDFIIDNDKKDQFCAVCYAYTPTPEKSVSITVLD